MNTKKSFLITIYLSHSLAYYSTENHNNKNNTSKIISISHFSVNGCFPVYSLNENKNILMQAIDTYEKKDSSEEKKNTNKKKQI
jgi:hypothetical protein